MGRRKIEMKRIEDKSSRQVTFSKRRSGLMKKARELSILCDVEVALVVFSTRGRLYEFCSSGSSRLSQVLKRYQDSNASQTSSIVNEMENLQSDYIDIETCPELVKTVERFLDGPDIQQLSVDDCAQLEKQLNAALIQARTQKVLCSFFCLLLILFSPLLVQLPNPQIQLMQESMMTLREQERMLREENEQLKEEVATLKGSYNNRTNTNLGFNNLEDADRGRRRPQGTLPLLM